MWPPNPNFLLNWVVTNWLSLSERVLLVIISILLWKFCYPSFNSAQTFSFGWIAQTYSVNFLTVLAVAGSLHWYFYIYNGQKRRLKFDPRGMGKNNKLWDFSNQVHDNIFWSLGSGVSQLTAFIAQ